MYVSEVIMFLLSCSWCAIIEGDLKDCKFTSSSGFLLSAVSLHRILEIREGQLTAKFDKFPYDEVWYQSFSIVFEGMKSKCRLSTY